MIADSTEMDELENSKGIAETVYRSVHNLFPIRNLKAGVSIWARNQFFRNNVDKNDWLRQFVDKHNADCSSLAEFAVLMQQELRELVAPINVDAYPSGTIGFHLAGFVNFNGVSTPTLYHVHNGLSRALSSRGVSINPRIINANQDLPPDIVQDYFFKGLNILYRNGFWITSPKLTKEKLQPSNSVKKQYVPEVSPLEGIGSECLPLQLEALYERQDLSGSTFSNLLGKIDVLLITPKGVYDQGVSIF